MPPYLLEKLYNNIKRVIAQDITLTDRKGVIYTQFSDLKTVKVLTIKDLVRADQHSLEIEKYRDLRAIPIFVEERFYLLIVINVQAEDLQKVQIISSLAELIIAQFIAEHKPRPDAIDLLLTRIAFKNITIDAEEFSQQISALGYQLDRQWVAIALELKGFWENYLQIVGAPLGDKEDLIAAKKRDIGQSLNSFFSKNQDNIIGYIGNDQFLILKDLHDSDYQKFCDLLQHQFKNVIGSLKNVHIKEVTVAIGQSANSPVSLLESASQALLVLKIGKKIIGSDQVHRYDSLGILPLIIAGNESERKKFAYKIYSLIEDPELLETLEIYLKDNLNLTKTAESLKIHRNTVIYRLDKITQLLKKDPRNFEEAVELYLAYLFKKISD